MSRVRFNLPRYFLIACLVILPRAIHAQNVAWPLDGPAFSASPTDIAAAAAKIPAEKFAPITVLYEEEKDVLDAAGRVTNTHRVIYRIETQAAVEAWSEASVEWEAFYQQEPEIHARVIRPDGAAVELDQKTLTDVPAQNESDGTYSDERIHKAPLPGLAVGAIVEEETIRADKDPLFSAGGVYRTYFQREVPIVRSRLIFEAPTGTVLQYRVNFLPEIEVKSEETGGIHRLIFDQGHLAPIVRSDINLATSKPLYPTVEVSTGKSWQSVADTYRQLAEPQIQPDQVKQFNPRATGDSPSERLARIQVLVSKLHKEVRYTGIEFGQSKLQPQTPAEVLKRHYGDCKDKAALLVAMLRASGIPANLALLNAGPGRDVTPELPGMNQFDHAIVYVPPQSPAEKPLWIDATAEFTQVGDLPYGDQGRLALIIADGTHDLTQIPEPRPEDSVLVETREFTLADYGPARAVESSHTTGYVDSEYRADYGQGETKQLRESLDNYAKNAYGAKKITSIEHGDPTDFTKPFFFRIEMEKAVRGNTDIKDAAAVLFPTGTYGSLPRWFAIDPDAGDQKLTPAQEADRAKAEQQRSPDYEVPPFITERRYILKPPPGFLLRTLPPDKTRQMGPATLAETYTADANGVVTAVFRFNTGKARYAADEALALRKAVLQTNKEDAVVILYDQAGAKQLADGKVREALATDRALIDAHPNDALPHVRFAYALLEAGVGAQARAEALKATTLDPKSAIAFSTLGWVAQFNEIGVHFGIGFDLQIAIDAYRKSKELDPENLETRTNLAILYEYDSTGVRYASVPGLKSAIQEYRDLKQQDKAVAERYQDNILFDMLYAHEYKELLAEIEPLPATNARQSLGIAATIATEGLDAGIKRADRISGDADRSTALRNAGTQLIVLQMYPEAAGVLSAAIQGQQDASTVARQIEIFRTLKPYTQAPGPDTTPSAVIQRMMASTLSGKLTTTEAARLVSPVGYPNDPERQRDLQKAVDASAQLRGNAQRSGLTPANLADVSLGTMKLSTNGDDAIGYQVTMQMIGAAGQQFFVMKEGSGYQVVASQGDFAQVGNAALYFLHHGNEAQAKAILDWKRDLLHKGGGDDALEGALMPRFWTSGESKGPEAIELAAASLLIGTQNVAALLPAIAARRDKWTSAQGKPDLTDYNLLLATGYVTVGDGTNGKKAAEALLKDNPDSATAARLAGLADNLNRDYASWNAMLDLRLAKHPTDRDLLSQKAFAAQAQGNFAEARKTLRAVLDSSQATSNDYNNYAWNSLFENNVDADAIQAAQQGNMLSKNSSFNELHTLSCLYAAQGKTTEAKQVLFQAMEAANLDQPNSPSWYAFGAIYQQYGVNDAAIAAFKKVEKPEGPIMPVDTYVLAQSHLKELHALE